MTDTEKTMAFAAVSITTGILSSIGKNQVLGAISIASLVGCVFHEAIEDKIKNFNKEKKA